MKKIEEMKNNQSSKKSEKISELFPVIAVRDVVMFPQMTLSVFVGRENSLKNLDYASEKKQKIFVVAQKNSSIMKPTKKDLYNHGTVSTILQVMKFNDNTVRVTLGGNYRAKMLTFKKINEVEFAKVEKISDYEVPEKKSLVALNRILLQEFEKYAKIDIEVNPDIQAYLSKVVEAEKEVLVQTILQALNLELKDCQKILEMNSIEEQIKFLIKHLRSEIEITTMKKKIQGRIRSQINRTQREYYLNEQLKAIRKELGVDDSKNSHSNLYRRLMKLRLPKEIFEHFSNEIEKLKNSNMISTENAVIQNYLDLALSLPWNKHKKISVDLKKAEKILNENHYGIDKVKDRIIEYLAVRKHAGENAKSPILCLVGPPGVGKTSLGKSVAASIETDFIRVCLGGVRDEAEIRGHRKTYIGAMPGKIIQNLKKIKHNNPLIMLDEIDKISSDYKGDPSSALLEVLDPEQNSKFVDHYLEVEYDLSKVIFICTANSTNIPIPLLDRMEIVRLSSYTEQEKFQIAKIHLISKQMKSHGLKASQLNISDEVIRQIINDYTREAGVRNLEREISKICRKVVRKIVNQEEKKFKITVNNLHDYLGIPKYIHEKKNDSDIPGVTNGLAWTETGGDILVTEAVIAPGKGKVSTTGHLGDVMKESSQVAFACVKSLLEKYPDNFVYSANDLKEKDIHIHVPAGAIPKDGPSAGITMATSIASLLANLPVDKDLAMTGELSLVGRVLPIGGLKEKMIAAHKNGVSKIIIPHDNLKDLEDISQEIKKGIRIFSVKNIIEVLKIAIPQISFSNEIKFLNNKITINEVRIN